MIKVEDVSMKYMISHDRIQSLKEYTVAFLKRKLVYEEFWALKHISFEVQKGEVMGIIGQNGAGKSTLLKVISGILKPTSGQVVTEGNKIGRAHV